MLHVSYCLVQIRKATYFVDPTGVISCRHFDVCILLFHVNRTLKKKTQTIIKLWRQEQRWVVYRCWFELVFAFLGNSPDTPRNHIIWDIQGSNSYFVATVYVVEAFLMSTKKHTIISYKQKTEKASLKSQFASSLRKGSNSYFVATVYVVEAFLMSTKKHTIISYKQKTEKASLKSQFASSLRKHAYANILKIYHQNKWKFLDKKFWYFSYFC